MGGGGRCALESHATGCNIEVRTASTKTSRAQARIDQANPTAGSRLWNIKENTIPPIEPPDHEAWLGRSGPEFDQSYSPVDVIPRARARRFENHVEILEIAGYSIILAPIGEPSCMDRLVGETVPDDWVWFFFCLLASTHRCLEIVQSHRNADQQMTLPADQAHAKPLPQRVEIVGHTCRKCAQISVPGQCQSAVGEWNPSLRYTSLCHLHLQKPGTPPGRE